ncbi:ArsR/SmtB family transcription factor [Aquihabitans sp. McL0605]|uniref:ArsR/SmtB family transcription factor n=1 Tax=Aquihabitans sp. McL0605 TaxID=3415671 RepID=UPI003CE740A5
MLKHSDPLSLAFQALADPTRRQLVDRLIAGPASVTQLHEPLEMTMSAVVQHLTVLEAAGLVRSEKLGRVRTFQVDSDGLRRTEAWLHERRTPTERRLDRLEAFLDPTTDTPDATDTDTTHPNHHQARTDP